MASPTIDDIVPLIYHEKQEPGSALCAQHALNTLLQEHIFSATDLSQIARSLDELETAFDQSRGQMSTNMDDTGFFSIQVLENALDVWGLSLPRWRSEAMRASHDHPEYQLAFILNLEQHWFTLRRFGNRSLGPTASDDSSHWFNLNSFLEKPQWVSDLYLDMVLHQAESDGYSIFAVVPKDPDAPLPLMLTDSDRLAARCPTPSSTRAPENFASREHPASSRAVQRGFEDEDYELQAAIAASMGTEYYRPTDPRPRPPVPAPSLPSAFPGPSYPVPGAFPGSVLDDDDDDDDTMDTDMDRDPVEASRRRNMRLLAQFQREQGAASRDLDIDALSARRRQEQDDEDAELQRALAESEAFARAEGHAALEPGVGEEPAPLRVHSGEPPRAGPGHRVYDDEDEELQAALRASLEDVPPGFVLPDSPRTPLVSPPPSTPAPAPIPAVRPVPEKVDAKDDADDAEPEPPTQEIDLEEMRRRRLARFGGGT
ncbi:Josephin-domain-containing protein [Vararia minispora EC-137]|uniref:Josephin-domain-containing protein n=1 Tax=Vararia minispora EC-137 TaxID=1314806 RepID=A0ACB8Q8K9_9AGAM|nr:Josephin-domain-containing protein [Vararia minispora EC-137]